MDTLTKFKVTLGLAIIAVGILGSGFVALFEIKKAEKREKPVDPGLIWYIGALSFLPESIYLAILLLTS